MSLETRDRKPQQVTRIPEFRPGQWVKIRETAPRDLAGRVLRVKSLVCTIVTPTQKTAQWHVHLENGRRLDPQLVERTATFSEIRAAERRRAN